MGIISFKNKTPYRAPDLREQVLNAVMVETPRGIRLAKENASKKIDACVALAMAVWACQQAKGGVSRVRVITYGGDPLPRLVIDSDEPAPEPVTVAEIQRRNMARWLASDG